MVHIHKNSGLSFDIGFLEEFDTTIIFLFPDFEHALEDDHVELVGWYFGEYDYDTTEYYIQEYFNSRT